MPGREEPDQAAGRPDEVRDAPHADAALDRAAVVDPTLREVVDAASSSQTRTAAARRTDDREVSRRARPRDGFKWAHATEGDLLFRGREDVIVLRG